MYLVYKTIIIDYSNFSFYIFLNEITVYVSKKMAICDHLVKVILEKAHIQGVP